jgi:hypothetical protein
MKSRKIRTSRPIVRRMPKANRFHRECLEFLIRICAGSGQPDPLDCFHWFGYLAPPHVRTGTATRNLADAVWAKAETFAPLVSELRLVLAAAAEGGHYELPIPSDSNMVAEFAPSARQTFLRTSDDGDENDLGLRRAIIFGAMRLLNTEEGLMVRLCDRQPCRRIFLKTRPKQIFCSRRCASAAAGVRFLVKYGEEGARLKHRESAKHSARLRRLRRKRQARDGLLSSARH